VDTVTSLSIVACASVRYNGVHNIRRMIRAGARVLKAGKREGHGKYQPRFFFALG